MKNLYKIDRITTLGVILISIFMSVIQMIVSDPSVADMPQMGKWLKLLVYFVGAIVGFAIMYWLYTLLLRNNDNYKLKLIVNMAIGLTVKAILVTIIYLIAGKTNVWVNGIAGFIGFGSLAGLNWMTLQISQSDKIKISVLTAIWFVLALV